MSQEPLIETKSIEQGISQEPHVVPKENEERAQDPEIASGLKKFVRVSSFQINFEKAGTSKEKYSSHKKSMKQMHSFGLIINFIKNR